VSRDRSWNDGDKLSFSERDRLRREGGREKPQSSAVSKAQEERAKQQYMKKLDGIFEAPGAEVEMLAAAVSSAHGTAKLGDACRAYRDAAGYPEDAKLVAMFLDCGDAELIAGSLEAMLAACANAGFKSTAGLRSQIRMLVDGRDSRIAGLAEELLENL
jgi:hypothetical protein